MHLEETSREVIYWIHVDQDMARLQAFVNSVMNLKGG
jgi:hypothetical protein